MANGASRIFKVMQNSGTDTVSELVHLKVKTINPLTFTLDDRVTLTEDFVELNSNINKSNLKIDDILTAFSLNGGQLFFIQQYFSENPISRELPAGGNQGQILSKKSNEDYDAQWIDNNGGITGDTLPIGAVVEFKGTTVPANWEEFDENPNPPTTYVDTNGTVDLNDYTDQGYYFFTTTNTIKNVPAGVNGWLQVIKDKDSGTWAKQIWYKAGTANSNDYQTYVRTRMNGVWSNWKQYQMVEDTGWQNLTLDSRFHAYDDTSSNTPQYRKVGNVVHVRGVIAPVSNLDSESNTTFATLPSRCRPSKATYSLHQGSGTKIWMLTIYSNGNMNLGRYRDGASWNTVYSDHWFPFNFTFLAD